jgi:CDP-diacylglycerol--glycerol-3-phosphate 3-phosphatidyltransferase
MRFDYADYLAAAIFILGAATDGLDGYIARKNKQVTLLGKFMDPLADKILVSAALIALVEHNLLSGWVAVVIISREFAVTGLRAVAATEGVIMPASILGKIKTATQIVAIVAMFIGDIPFKVFHFILTLGHVAMAVAVVFTIWSGMDYFLATWKLLKRKGY